jgi:glycine/D-amino acid oxidase-like deaminating enzyme
MMGKSKIPLAPNHNLMMGSPWLEEYERHRPVLTLSDDMKADVVVVGGGISGMLTAYFLMKSTDLSVIVAEKDLIGHGATGHNGGQVVAALERGHEDLSDALGEERVAQGYLELGEAWQKLDRLLVDIRSPRLHMTTAQLGIALREDLRYWSEEGEFRQQLGLPTGTLRVAEDIDFPVELEGKAQRVSRDELDLLLWSKGRRFIAALEMRIGLLNSYALSERLAEALLARYQERFTVVERSPIDRIDLNEKGAVLLCGDRKVLANDVVLCTNGYRIPTINSETTPAVEGMVQGVVGYMVGLTSDKGEEGARAFFMGGDEPYFYLTRRPHTGSWLTAVGGPEEAVVQDDTPTRAEERDAFLRIDKFVDETLVSPLGFRDHYWLGLMGYTSNGVRVVGMDPGINHLYYNLGCNGIGLLSAVAGGERLSRMMAGEKVPPSMYDPDASLAIKRREAQRTR